MPQYKAPLNEVFFLLNDVFGLKSLQSLPSFSDLSADLVEQILIQAAKLCEETLAPLNASGDRIGCVRDAGGRVVAPPNFKAAYRAFAEGGWVGLPVPEEYGGQGLPYTLSMLIDEFASSANMALAMYPGLTQGALAALLRHGTQQQKLLYAPKLAQGRWTGTMNLTEPQCGTDLGLLTTKALPRADGSFSITGQKIFISAGEHDLTENIIHLVLARIEGAPAGVKGISLFIVPKILVNENGELGARNTVSCGAIEEKMGIHGNATCVMNYDGAQGFLLGEANRGLNAMFVMMNEARLGVAVQGLAQSEVAYQNAVSYAKDRLQGRALTGVKNPDKNADPIIVHPDVRRMLLEIKSFNEPARALAFSAAIDSDIVHHSSDPQARLAAEDRLGLLTPVMKGVFTDIGFENCVKAQQVYGGHGYVREWGMEQFVRDARIAMIYEGANGIQAIDLVGRKLPRENGRAVMAFFKDAGDILSLHANNALMNDYVLPVQESLDHLQKATVWLMNNAISNPDNAGAASYDYMHLFGRVALGVMWVKIAHAALVKKAQQTELTQVMDSKLLIGKFYMERMLPETAYRLIRISSGAVTMMSMPVEMF
ncbi:acyl-CoA dehydrogenase [Methylocystaceae bacterium]|nr:acyl-CoA dehydrogenase [Methylocystaceae bacterium]